MKTAFNFNGSRKHGRSDLARPQMLMEKIQKIDWSSWLAYKFQHHLRNTIQISVINLHQVDVKTHTHTHKMKDY